MEREPSEENVAYFYANNPDLVSNQEKTPPVEMTSNPDSDQAALDRWDGEGGSLPVSDQPGTYC